MPRQLVGRLVGQRCEISRQSGVGLVDQDIANKPPPGYPPRPLSYRSQLSDRAAVHSGRIAAEPGWNIRRG